MGQKLRLPVEEFRKAQRYFTPEESQRIIDAAPEPWNICFAFTAYLGLRTSEAVGVAWEHIDLDADVLRARQSNWRRKLPTVKSKSSVRDLPLPPVLVEMLKDHGPRWRFNPLGLCVRPRERPPDDQLLRASGYSAPDPRAGRDCAVGSMLSGTARARS